MPSAPRWPKCSGVEIHGAEHYLERNGFLTCAAAPIVSATGELLGVLDISGDQRSRHPHTLGLVNTAARMIENRLVLAACQRRIRLHLHAHPEGIGTVAEGIVALSDDGWIVGANRQGLALLGLVAADIGRNAAVPRPRRSPRADSGAGAAPAEPADPAPPSRRNQRSTGKSSPS